MDSLYGESHRKLQQQFDTQALADSLEAAIVNPTLQTDQVEFVARQTMFFLSSIDEQARPTVSYKGGAPGFVKVLSDKALMFPNYNGNGMYFSMGNIMANSQIGLLFIDFQTPNRLRVQGRATLIESGAEMSVYPGADLVVRVDIDQTWVNCARYIHQFKLAQASPYVPQQDGSAPVAMWKRIEGMAEMLSESDRTLVAQAGTITAEDYAEKLAAGEVV